MDKQAAQIALDLIEQRLTHINGNELKAVDFARDELRKAAQPKEEEPKPE